MANRIRILFIGELASSHFLNWLQLFTPCGNDFEFAGINLLGQPESDLSRNLALHSAYAPAPLPEARNYALLREPDWRDWWGYVPQATVLTHTSLKNSLTVINDFRPHLIHTLGLFPGGMYYQHLLRCLRPKFVPPWLIQARGGPDIALNRDNPHLASLIREMLGNCDCFLADNRLNYQYAQELGLEAAKLSSTGPVPGTGGIDCAMFADVPLPSKKEQLILWPKAYFFIQSDGLPVARALQSVLANLPEARLVATAAVGEVEYWLRKFLAPYSGRVEIYPRLPYAEMTALYKRARVLLIPSLSDGVPNSMYEAMASHTVPVISPLDTLTPVFRNRKHAVYADNLNPQEISRAVITLMRDDALADSIAIANRSLLPELAGREAVREKVLKLYRELVERDAYDGWWRNDLDQLKVERDQTRAELDQTRAERDRIGAELSQVKAELAQAESELAQARRIRNHPLVRALLKLRRAMLFWR
jgi:glycosyltransferase involved in cell wall biosynthesis